ncbi:MAG: PAS domain S-box protein, partial [Desulfuromonadaceae bacterium]
MTDGKTERQSGRILVVDDTSANLQLLTNLLTEEGYTVYPASDGELALEFVRTTLPDLILLDIRMPGMDGFEVCRRLKEDERISDVPVIFISILEDEREKVLGFEAGAVDYITKPFQSEEVLARIQTHLRLRELTERLEQKVEQRTAELSLVNQRLREEISERKLAEEALQVLNDELEQRVQNRTAELEAQNEEMRQTEKTLTREREFSRALLESMADGVVACDAQGTLALFNRAAREWHGVDLMRLPPEQWASHYDLFCADGVTPLSTDQIPLAMAFQGKEIRDVGMAIVARGQAPRFILASGSQIRDPEGKKLGAVAVMRDVTELRRMEQELRRANEELLQRVDEQTAEIRANEHRLAEAQRIAHIGSWELDLQTNHLSWSDEIFRIFEIDPEQFGASYEAFLDAIHPADREAVDAAYTGSLKSKTPYAIDHRLLFADGRIKYVHERCETLYDNDTPLRSVGTVQNITKRKLMEDALFFVAQRGWQTGGENFCKVLAQFLGERLAIDYVVIDRLAENPEIAETLAIYAQGNIIPNLRYALKGTPCENVMRRELCVYPQEVQKQFPEDGLLAEMGVESYVGIPLWASNGRPIGLIALMNRRPMADPSPAVQVLQLVATRAAAELEREESDLSLRRREREFRTLAENSPDCIARYDSGCQIVYVNPALERTLAISTSEMLGKPPAETKFISEAKEYQEKIAGVLTTGEAAEIDLVLPDRGEGQRYHNIRLVAERGENEAITGVLGIGRDITEKKRMETELASHRKHLEELVKERTVELEKKNTELERMNKLFVGRELRM